MARICLGSMLLALVAGCGPGREDILLSGTVVYDAYTSGPIRLEVVEDDTVDCGLFSCSEQTPGDTVKTVDLDRPGPFSIHANVQESDSQTGVVLLAYALGAAANTWDCEAGAALSLTVRSHTDLELVLERGQCPALQ